MPDILEILPHHPEYSLTNSPGFSTCYRLAHSISCPVEGHSPPTTVLDRGKERTCALCDGNENTTTFQKDAHTVPAAFGNRHHFTKEECDNCNAYYGTEYEQQLALWFAPERTFHRIRSRESPPKLFGPDGSVIEVDGVTGALVLKSDFGKNALNENMKELDIPYVRPACNRVSGLRSLLKTAWLLLTPDERKRHPLILQLIKKETVLSVWEYWQLDLPGNGSSSVKFEIWEKYGDPALKVAPLLIRFIVGKVLILWAEPNSSTGKQVPSPLPPIQTLFRSGEQKSISANLFEIKKDEIFPSKEDKLTFKYESVTKGPSQLNPRTPPKLPQHKIAIKLVPTANGESALNTTCTIRLIDQQRMKLFISGGEFGGAFITEFNGYDRSTTAKIIPKLEDVSALFALKTVRFLKLIRDRGGSIDVIDEKGESIFVISNIADNGSIPIPASEELISDIVTLNEKFDLDIRYNGSASQEDFMDLYILADSIRNNGSVKNPKSIKSLTLHGEKSVILKLLDIYEVEGPFEFSMEQSVIYNLWGNMLPEVRRKTVFTKAFPTESIKQLRARISTTDDDAKFDIELSGDTLVYQFNHWQNKR